MRLNKINNNFQNLFESRLSEVLKAFSDSHDSVNVQELEYLSKRIMMAFNSSNTVFIFGNGGSAAEASHIAAEFTGHCVHDHEPWPVMSLSDSNSAITAITNDYTFDDIFLRQIKAFARKGDIAIGLSTSGTSKNIRKALDYAKENGLVTSLWTSSRFLETSTGYDYVISAATSETPRAQELHLFWGHLISEYIESQAI
jgi:D-sedoheptulose 7-phosphate isomerase